MPFLEIKVPTFDTDDLRKRLIKTLDRRGRRNENLLLRTTQFFETVQPVFQSDVEKVGEDFQVITGPQDDDSGRIWSYLDQGTEVRYATMEEEFVAGTTPGTFETTPSVGGVQFVNVDVPQEGIEARGWTDLLAEQEQPRFAGEMRQSLSSWLKDFSSKASKVVSG